MNGVFLFNEVNPAIDTGNLLLPVKKQKEIDPDWLINNWRQLRWTENGLSYLIEIYPDTGDPDSSWNLHTSVTYTENSKTFYLNRHFAVQSTLENIAQDFTGLITSCYKYIRSIKKEDIPVL